jgi:hypothetical protein
MVEAVTAHCAGCSRIWTGMAECHCPEPDCHRHFTGLSAFDAHFAKDGSHQDPPLVWPDTGNNSKRAGLPAFEIKHRASGPVFGAVGDNVTLPRFVALRKDRRAEIAS